MARSLTLVALAACAACRSETAPAPSAQGSARPSVAPADAATSAPATPRTFLSSAPTLVVGTAGDDHADRATAGQAALLQALGLPRAVIAPDTFDVTRGPAAWPAAPVVYGGAHVNRAIAGLGARLPFSITTGRLAIGDRVFEGDDLALVTVVPARATDAAGPGYPAFLLYAGTGTPGIAEINSPSVMRIDRAGKPEQIDAPIVVADAFGPLVRGRWTSGDGGAAIAELDPPFRRVGWREVQRDVAGVAVTFRFFDKSDPAGDAEAIAASTRGIATAATRLAGTGARMTLYIHPDRRSKAVLTGNAGDGHAVGFARVLHVVPAGAALELLVAHEATHVLAPQVWGPAGSALFGEGLAVWIAGRYGDAPLGVLRERVATPAPPSIVELLGGGFRALPEATAYAYGAILVDVLVAKLGISTVRDHFYGATARTWADACIAAGTRADAIDAMFVAALAPR